MAKTRFVSKKTRDQFKIDKELILPGHEIFDDSELKEFRCQFDNRLLFKGNIKSGTDVEIKCPSCRNVLKISVL